MCSMEKFFSSYNYLSQESGGHRSSIFWSKRSEQPASISNGYEGQDTQRKTPLDRSSIFWSKRSAKPARISDGYDTQKKISPSLTILQRLLVIRTGRAGSRITEKKASIPPTFASMKLFRRLNTLLHPSSVTNVLREDILNSFFF